MQTAQLQKLKKHDTRHLTRVRHTIANKNHMQIMIDGKPFINFCSNDYLNIANHPAITKSFKQGIDTYGLGSGASALVSGYTKAHAALEEAFATFLNRERALLFNSGYHANLGVLTALANRNSTIIADKFCHASLIDGALLSRAKFYRYRHQKLNHAEMLLQQKSNSHPDYPSLLIAESIFSMQGTLTDVKNLAELAKKHRALFIVDDAHGIGVLGENGKGICEHAHLSQEEIPCLITPLGKAMGSMGAIVSGNQWLIESLLQFSRTYCYSTALPPAICHATIEAIKIIQNESWRRKKLNDLIHFFIKEAEARKLTLFSKDITPIKSIMIGSNEIAKKMHQTLLQKQLYVACIREPTIPKNMACIRISLCCMHTEAEITYLLDQTVESHAKNI